MHNAVDQAIDFLAGQSAYVENDEQADALHYHLSDGTELTLISSLYDTEMHLKGEVDAACRPLDIDTCAVYLRGEHDGMIVVEHPVNDTITFRVRACDDPTCHRLASLNDCWL
jgi:hypothetical protein